MTSITVAFALLLLPVIAATEIPVGTVIPVMLSSSLNAEKDKPEKKLEGRVMQEVSLPSGQRIREGARIVGHVVDITRGSSGSRMVVRFEAIRDKGRTTPLKTGLLALASMASVRDAGLPISANSDPTSQWVTRQVGGDVVRRGQGTVLSHHGVYGTWLEGSSVLISLTPNPEAGCSGGPGYDREQAVWIFSSAACGTYGLRKMKIASSGAVPPLGDIALISTQNVTVSGGSGWLLIAVAERGD
jgi:hypothetical protein